MTFFFCFLNMLDMILSIMTEAVEVMADQFLAFQLCDGVSMAAG